MLDAEKPLFLQVSHESKNLVLHPGKVIGIEDNTYALAFDREEALSCEVEDGAFIYFEDSRAFMQQSVRICSISEAESGFQITVETTSDPVSADSRECFRVSMVRLGLTVTVGDEQDCLLLDVSASGLSATTSSSLKLGDEILLALSYDGREYTGKVIVHSVRKMDRGRIRHGFHCAPDRRGSGTLQQGLQTVSASAQRLLIKSMARA